MKNPFSPGDSKVHRHVVTADDTARFESGEVHAVYSTFALARDAEWAGRQFVLEMKEDDEEGIGTAIRVTHKSPARIGDAVEFTSVLAAVERNEIITPFVAKVGERVVATGESRQKILKKEKLRNVFAALDAG